MAEYYFDSSALVKRYAYESGTDWVLQVTESTSGNEIVVARIAGAEVLAAIVRKQRAGGVDHVQAQRAVADFEADFEVEYYVIEITPAVIKRAMSLIKRYGLRGYDSIQLACAMEVNEVHLLVGLPPLIFVSADKKMKRRRLKDYPLRTLILMDSVAAQFTPGFPLIYDEVFSQNVITRSAGRSS